LSAAKANKESKLKLLARTVPGLSKGGLGARDAPGWLLRAKAGRGRMVAASGWC